MAMAETRHPVSLHVDGILNGLPASPITLSIIKIDEFLNTTAGTDENHQGPKLVSIGAIHCRNDQLKKMEQHKLRYLKELLQRRGEATVDRYVVALLSLEERARRCYANDASDVDTNTFVEMLLLDGFFIIELLRKYSHAELRERDDPLFKYGGLLSQVVQDLMCVENQIPICIIELLLTMTKIGNRRDDAVFLVQHIVARHYPFRFSDLDNGEPVARENVDHLFGLMYKTWWSPSFARMRPGIQGHLIESNMPCATELRDYGIVFHRGDEGIHFMDIKFEHRVRTIRAPVVVLGFVVTSSFKFIDRVMKIPTFIVDYNTESCLKNLILYEHFFHKFDHPKYVTDYVFLLNGLIQSPEDVKFLRRQGILAIIFGNDDTVLQMLKRLQRIVAVSRDFWYADIYDDVNKHCKLPGNVVTAELRRYYSNNRLALITFFTAYLQLAVQTVLGLLTYLTKRRGA